MTLTRKLLLSYVAVVVAACGTLVIAADRSLRMRLTDEAAVELEREAVYLAAAARGASQERLDSLTYELARRTGRRLTLIGPDGRVLADSDFPRTQLADLENHAERPEVAAALAGRTGRDLRMSASTGRPELKVAVPYAGGVARVSSPLPQVDAVVRRAQGAVLLGALVAAAVAIALAWGFSRRVVLPLVLLRDAAQSIARGEHPTMDARGRDEIGDLARALRTVDENLSARLAQLARERSESEALVTSMVEGVIACDARGAVTTVNPAARRLLGLGPDEPAPPATLLFRQRAAHDAVTATLGGTTIAGLEAEVDALTLLISGRPLPGGGAVIVLHDITELKRLESVRRDFVGNVSHELKTPLTVVRGYAETLAADDPPAHVRAGFLKAMLANAHRMQRLVDDLLDLSRIESRAWAPAPADVAVEPLARDVWQAIATTTGTMAPAFATDIGPGADTVRVDPEALRQILTNTLENARRYTPDTGSVTVRTRRTARGVQLEIADTGSGIPGEHLPRIFERFYRVDPHRSREAGGTGLGLAIVKHLVEAHGGEAGAESRLGAGTTIRIVLPGGG